MKVYVLWMLLHTMGINHGEQLNWVPAAQGFQSLAECNRFNVSTARAHVCLPEGVRPRG